MTHTDTLPLSFLIATDEPTFAARCRALTNARLADMEDATAQVVAVTQREIETLMGCEGWTPVGYGEGKIPYTMLGTADFLAFWWLIEWREVEVVPGIMGYREDQVRISEWGKRYLERGVGL